MAESCRNERKRLRSLSDSDKQSTSSKFEISEEEWLEVLGRLKDLESKRDSDSARIEELQQQLSTVKEENLRLKLELSSYKDSLEFTQKEYDESKDRISQVENDANSNKTWLVKQELYNRRWNLLFFGVNEEHDENCKEKVKKIISEKLQIHNVDSMKFCGVHRVGRKRFARRRNRPIICRFTCREDQERVYKAKAKLKNTQIYITDDVPEETREIRRKLLVPAMKRIKQTNLNGKVTIVGDRLLHDGYFYEHNKIPSRWLPSEDPEDE